MATVLSNEVKQALQDIYYNERTGRGKEALALLELSLIHISEPTRREVIS